MQKYHLHYLQCTKFNKKTRKYNSYHGSCHIVLSLFNCNFKAYLMGHKLATNVSEFRYRQQNIQHKICLSSVMDLCNNEVVTYNISNHLALGFTLKQDLDKFKNLPYRNIVHNDQGIQF